MYRIGLQYLQKDHLVAQTMYIGITSATSSSVFFSRGAREWSKILGIWLAPLQNKRKPEKLSFEKEHGLSNLQVQIGVLWGV